MIRSIGTSCVLLALAACTQARAQQSAETNIPSSADAPMEQVLLPGDRKLVAGTLVELEIIEPVNSETRKRGEKFGLRLHAPLIVDGIVALPAGVAGVGEIVHADRARGGGKPGELLLTARYLDYNGMHIPLRGFKVGGNGKDHSQAALAMAMAVGPFAQFIHGGEVEIPAATIAQARLAQDLVIPADMMTPSAGTGTALAEQAHDIPAVAPDAAPSTPTLPADATSDPGSPVTHPTKE